MTIKTLASINLSDGRPQIFASKSDGRIVTLWKVSTDPDSAWTHWQPFPGSPANIVALTVVPLPDARPQLFASDGLNIFTTWKETVDPDAAWVAWQTFPAP